MNDFGEFSKAFTSAAIVFGEFSNATTSAAIVFGEFSKAFTSAAIVFGEFSNEITARRRTTIPTLVTVYRALAVIFSHDVPADRP